MRSESCPQRAGWGTFEDLPALRWRDDVSSGSSGGPAEGESVDEDGQAVLSPRADLVSFHTDGKKRVSALEEDLMAAFLDAKRSGFVTEVQRESPLVLLAREGDSPLQSAAAERLPCSSGAISFVTTPLLDDISPCGRHPSKNRDDFSDRFKVAKGPSCEDLLAHARRKKEREHLLRPNLGEERELNQEDDESTSSNGLPSALLCGGHCSYSPTPPSTPQEKRGIGGSSRNLDLTTHPNTRLAIMETVHDCLPHASPPRPLPKPCL